MTAFFAQHVAGMFSRDGHWVGMHIQLIDAMAPTNQRQKLAKLSSNRDIYTYLGSFKHIKENH
ncbi:MAG: hypothetical protein KKF37_00250 [Proteobacteria bacterium]|nr:hypothetical protein [Pseudomonadota bacterium]